MLAALVVGAGLLVWRDDILEAFLDPQIPFAVYRPPPAPDYRSPAAWARAPEPGPDGGDTVDVFFVHPTTFDGGRDWLGAITDRPAARRLIRNVIPNYAAPFAAAGPVFIPRYRQASLYTSLSLFDDAVEAREFAYRDVASAFTDFLDRIGPRRRFVVVGVEQGGALAARLLDDVVSRDPALRRRLVAAYLIETAVPAAEFVKGAPLDACRRPDQTGCVVAYVSASTLDFVRARRILDRSLVWRDQHLIALAGDAPLCVNPLWHGVSDAPAPARLAQGAANATGLEWGARPGLMARQAGAQCRDGILRVTLPRSQSLRASGDWADRLRVSSYNLFWADLESDVLQRVRKLTGDAQPAPA